MLIYLQVIDDPKDKVKFEDLYFRYKNLLFYKAKEILHNEKDAEDALQEAFWAVAKNMKKISSPESHKTRAYLVTIVESKAIDLYRKKQAHPAGEYGDALHGVSVEYHGEDTLARCILALPAQHREVILLRYQQGYSTGEVAKLLGISPAAARKRLERAKAQLEKLCREEGLL